MNIQDIADFIDLVKNPAKYEKVLQNLKDEQARLNAVIATVGKVSEIEKIRKELDTKEANQDSEYKAKKEALEATYVSKINKVEKLQVKLEADVKKVVDMETAAASKEQAAKDLAASFNGREKAISAKEKELQERQTYLDSLVTEYVEKVEKLRAVMV